jgi:GxxExxY protein
MTKVFLYKDLTEKIIRCFYNVYDELGGGFLESVYEKSLLIELKEKNINSSNQNQINVYYKNKLVDEYKSDIIVDDKILIEIKAVNKILPEHEAQLINYLKATKIKVGLLVNFGNKLEFIRRVF